MGKYVIEERLDWRQWVTPKPLGDKPIHRWYVFPHSFTGELVHGLIDELGLDETDHILDPFAGAGTTILAAKERGIPATGYDISPLAVLTSQVKILNLSKTRLQGIWKELEAALDSSKWNGVRKGYPDLVKKALPGRLLGAFDSIFNQIGEIKASNRERDFFRLALLSILPEFSRAEATGGWLKWVKKRNGISNIPKVFTEKIEMMLADLGEVKLPRSASWQMKQVDARFLPDKEKTYSAVITSPPYPNRHDYTRVFGVELMFAFLDWEQTRQLRYQSFHSHPEARPKRPELNGYIPPRTLKSALAKISRNGNDPRVPAMLEGYFQDIFLCLKEVSRVCKSGARVAFVIGNAQYNGQTILTDELTADIGEQAGLSCEKLIAIRYRGNSAQQMGKYGRKPSRESVVIFKRRGK